jgi:arginase
VPIIMSDAGLELTDGVEATQVLMEQLGSALQAIARHDPTRIATLGAPRPASTPGFDAMTVAALTGHGDPDLLSLLPAMFTALGVLLDPQGDPVQRRGAHRDDRSACLDRVA